MRLEVEGLEDDERLAVLVGVGEEKGMLDAHIEEYEKHYWKVPIWHVQELLR